MTWVFLPFVPWTWWGTYPESQSWGPSLLLETEISKTEQTSSKASPHQFLPQGHPSSHPNLQNQSSEKSPAPPNKLLDFSFLLQTQTAKVRNNIYESNVDGSLHSWRQCIDKTTSVIISTRTSAFTKRKSWETKGHAGGSESIKPTAKRE